METAIPARPVPYRYPREHIFPSGHTPIYARRGSHRLTEPAHNHDYLEVVLVLGGSARHRCPAGTRPLRPGDVIVLRPGAWHAYEDCHSLEIFNCCFGQELLQRELAWLLEDPALNPLLWGLPLADGRRGVYIFHLDAGARSRCQREFAALQRATSTGPPAPRAGLIGRLILLLSRTAQELRRQRQHHERYHPKLHPIASQAVRLLEQDLAQSWPTCDLARHLKIDGSYLIRLFKAATGLPPLAYQARRRAERAATLLVNSDEPITAIAARVGWPSPPYFARRFRACFGVSASAYRRRFRLDSNALAAKPPPG